MLLTSFGVAQLIGSPLFGWLADQSASRRTPLLWGFISNAAASVLLCFATNVWLLLLSRFLQGLSAAVVYTVGFALLADTVGSKDIGQWMGYVVASLNVGMAMSPVLGGILFEKAGYMSLFYVIFGLIGLDILLRLVMIEKKVAKKWVKPLVSKPCGIVSDYGTLQTSQDQAAYEQESDSRKLSNSEDQSIDSVEDSDVSSAEDNIYHTDPPLMTQPSLPLFTLIKSIRILTDIYGTLITVTLLVAFDTALPLFVERTFGWGSLGGGLIFLPITIPILASPLAGRLADTTNPRWLAITGNILAGFFTALLLLISHNSTKQVILIFVLLALYGSFRILGSSPLSADLGRTVASMERERPGIFGKSGAYAQVFSLYTSASAAGVVLGPVWTSFAYGEKSWTFLVLSLSILSASIAIPVFLFFKPGGGRADDIQNHTAV